MAVYPPSLYPGAVFPAAVFPGSGSLAGIVLRPGDRAVLDDLARRLRNTGAFDVVLVADSTDEARISTHASDTAVLIPSPQTYTAFDGAPGRFLRMGSYDLILTARGRDPQDCLDRAERLKSRAIVALAGVEYGGFCLFEHSVLPVAEQYVDDASGLGTYELTGTYAYVYDQAVGMED